MWMFDQETGSPNVVKKSGLIDTMNRLAEDSSTSYRLVSYAFKIAFFPMFNGRYWTTYSITKMILFKTHQDESVEKQSDFK